MAKTAVEDRIGYIETTVLAFTQYFEDEPIWKVRRVDNDSPSVKQTFCRNRSSKLAIIWISTIRLSFSADTLVHFAKFLQRLNQEFVGYETYLEVSNNAAVIGLKRKAKTNGKTN